MALSMHHLHLLQDMSHADCRRNDPATCQKENVACSSLLQFNLPMSANEAAAPRRFDVFWLQLIERHPCNQSFSHTQAFRFEPNNQSSSLESSAVF